MTNPAETTSTIPSPIPPALWGRDHWSTFGYIETRIVDHGGVPYRTHMRCDARIHPMFDHGAGHAATRLADGSVDRPHDDWSCLDDAEAAGLVANVGTGIRRVYKLTDTGRKVAALLREHKGAGGSFSTFRWTP